MASFDIFNDRAFSMVQMTSQVNSNPYRPGYLGSLNLFTPKPIATTAAVIELLDGTLNLIKTTPRGAPLEEGQREKRNLYYRETVRLAKGHTIMSDEIQSVRAFGSESELESMMSVIADRLNGPTGLIAQMEYTWENMRLGAVQGIVLDSDGSELVNWFTVLGVSQPTEIDFDLDNATPASGALRKVCDSVSRGVQRALGDLWLEGSSYVLGLCDDAFWDDLNAHPEVRETVKNFPAALELRGPTAFRQMEFGGIVWRNYRGSDDNSTVAIPANKVKFVPVNVPGLFDVAYAPSESMPFVNTRGRPLYSMIILDDKRQTFARPEVYSYPLFICTRPAALFRGKRT
jgi:hypothetical protein